MRKLAQNNKVITLTDSTESGSFKDAATETCSYFSKTQSPGPVSQVELETTPLMSLSESDRKGVGCRQEYRYQELADAKMERSTKEYMSSLFCKFIVKIQHKMF